MREAIQAASDRVTLNGVEIDYALHGPADGTPLVLIMGLGMQRIAWPDSLLYELVDRGFRCITFDNRDIGRSTQYTQHGIPSLPAVLASRLIGRRYRLPYALTDIADDSRALLEHLGIEHAHIAGISMGGMIAQHFARRHSVQTRSLTLMATSSGRLGLPLPRAEVLRTMLARPSGKVTEEQAIDYSVRLFGLIGSPAWPRESNDIAERARLSLRRARGNGSGVARQLAAIVNDGDRSPWLAELRAPTLILHGEDDPLVPLAHGQDLARHIPGARIETIPGWGHDLPDALASRLAALIAEHARG